MAKQIVRLRGVAEDKAGDVYTLLIGNHIDFYETPGGNWGISMPALWIKNESQEKSSIEARPAYDELKQRGNNRLLLVILAINLRRDAFIFNVYPIIC